MAYQLELTEGDRCDCMSAPKLLVKNAKQGVRVTRRNVITGSTVRGTITSRRVYRRLGWACVSVRWEDCERDDLALVKELQVEG